MEHLLYKPRCVRVCFPGVHASYWRHVSGGLGSAGSMLLKHVSVNVMSARERRRVGYDSRCGGR
jgi:hypothetical protein